MESKNILAATSLFCNQKNWPVVLRAIQQFIKSIHRESFFYLEFNYLSGENIRFSFLVKDKETDQLLQCIDEYFKKFFRCIEPASIQQNDGIFKNFEPNNIYYGLYNPILLKRGERRKYRLAFALSKLIIASLKDEDSLDGETILTLAYYFSASLAKTIIEESIAEGTTIAKFFEGRYQDLEKLGTEDVQAKYTENAPTLLDVYDSIGQKEEPTWIKTWRSFLLKSINNDGVVTQSEIRSVFEQVRIQLALNRTMEMMLCYFMFRVLSVKHRCTTAETAENL